MKVLEKFKSLNFYLKLYVIAVIIHFMNIVLAMEHSNIWYLHSLAMINKWFFWLLVFLLPFYILTALHHVFYTIAKAIMLAIREFKK